MSTDSTPESALQTRMNQTAKDCDEVVKSFDEEVQKWADQMKAARIAINEIAKQPAEKWDYNELDKHFAKLEEAKAALSKFVENNTTDDDTPVDADDTDDAEAPAADATDGESDDDTTNADTSASQSADDDNGTSEGVDDKTVDNKSDDADSDTPESDPSDKDGEKEEGESGAQDWKANLRENGGELLRRAMHNVGSQIRLTRETAPEEVNDESSKPAPTSTDEKEDDESSKPAPTSTDEK